MLYANTEGAAALMGDHVKYDRWQVSEGGVLVKVEDAHDLIDTLEGHGGSVEWVEDPPRTFVKAHTWYKDESIGPAR